MNLPLLLALGAAALVQPVQDPAELLPPAPEGWRFERIDMPLDFAPNLGWKGFEELRFAPGMFDAGSDSYWSYALALRIDGDHDVDRAFVEDFLVEYYWGLCSAVAGNRGLELDRDEFTVSVKRVEERYAARIHLVDAFVTGEAIDLWLELEAHPMAGETELFGIASPADQKTDVWRELLDMRTAWREARAPAALLNHVYVAVDQETYDAFLASELFAGLGVVEERDTVRGDQSYRGAYLYGDRTYIELVPPGGAAEAGGFGIAFGLESEGDSAEVAKALRGAEVKVFEGAMTRELEGEAHPWFQAVGVERAHAESRMQLFTMEYDRAFLDLWHRDRAPEEGSIGRRPVLERYAAALGRSEARAKAPLGDVVELRLELDEAEAKRLAVVLTTFGYEKRDEEGGARWVGPQLSIAVREVEGPGRLAGLGLSLRERSEKVLAQVGTIDVSLGERAGSLDF